MQSTTTTKMWLALGLATTLGGCARQGEPETQAPIAAAEPAQSQPSISNAEFAKALEKILAGEGGEGGGVNYQDGKLVISPLRGEHIQMAMSGNAFRRGEDIALEFKSDGTFTGVEHPWAKRESSVCEKAGKVAGFDVHEGQCMERTEVKFTDGRWSVKGDQLCTTPALPQAAESLECTQVFVAIDRIALFSADGAMLSKGIELVKGKKEQ